MVTVLSCTFHCSRPFDFSRPNLFLGGLTCFFLPFITCTVPASHPQNVTHKPSPSNSRNTHTTIIPLPPIHNTTKTTINIPGITAKMDITAKNKNTAVVDEGKMDETNCEYNGTELERA